MLVLCSFWIQNQSQFSALIELKQQGFCISVNFVKAFLPKYQRKTVAFLLRWVATETLLPSATTVQWPRGRELESKGPADTFLPDTHSGGKRKKRTLTPLWESERGTKVSNIFCFHANQNASYEWSDLSTSGTHEDFRAVLEPKSPIQEGSPGCLLRGTADFAFTNVTERDPMGPPRDRPFPHLLCFSSSLKHPGNSIWCTGPELFHRCENPSPNGRC